MPIQAGLVQAGQELGQRGNRPVGPTTQAVIVQKKENKENE